MFLSRVKSSWLQRQSNSRKEVHCAVWGIADHFLGMDEKGCLYFNTKTPSETFPVFWGGWGGGGGGMDAINHQQSGTLGNKKDFSESCRQDMSLFSR